MDQLTSCNKTRASRWSRDPVLDRGQPVVARLTDRDIEILTLLARYRYLPADDIHAHIGGEQKPVIRRLNLLSRKPNLYLNRPHQQRQNADANSRPLVYELDDRGSRVLRERGLPFLTKSYQRNFAHELMVCRVTASIELGVRANRAARLISWQEILANEQTPIATRNAARPERVPAVVEMNGETHRAEVAADGFPFGIERTHSGKRSFLFFPGFEADCGTEPLDSSVADRSSIHRKFAAYLAIVANGVHRSHFGFPNFFVPFVAPNRARMESMMRLLERITNGRGSKIFLFKTFPTLTSVERPSGPAGHMFSEPWQRVGFEPFSFGE